MSAVLDRALSQYLKTTTVPVSAKPVTMACWFKSTDTTNNQGLISITNNNNEFLHLQARAGIAGDPIGVLEYATAWKYAESSTGFSSGTWHHACCTFVSSTERSILIDGGSKVTKTDSQDVNFSLFDQILIGTHKTSGGAHLAGKIAHVAIWSIELSDAEILSLAEGANPQSVQNSSLVAYWDLDSDGDSVIDDNHLTGYNSPTYDTDDNPAVSGYGAPDAMAAYPAERAGTYDENKVWDEVTQTWVADEDLLAQAGSRYRAQLVTIAKDLIYFEDFV